MTPGAAEPERRLRAVVDRQGMVSLPSLGNFTAEGRSLRALEQRMLQGMNGNGELRAALRVRLAPISHDGFFFMPDREAFDRIVADADQLRQLDRDEHDRWQWIEVDRSLANDRILRRLVHTTSRSGKRLTMGRPAHPDLVGQGLTRGIDTSRTYQDTPDGKTAFALSLQPSTGLAMENTTRDHVGEPVLIDGQGRALTAAVIRAPLSQSILLTGGRRGLDEQTLQQLRLLFAAPG